MKAGAAIRDITPKAPIQLCGYPESPISTGTHDPFYIAAFYFADAQTKILYLTADLLFFARAGALPGVHGERPALRSGSSCGGSRARI